MYPSDEPDYKRFFIAVFLAVMVLLVWQAKVEWPRRQALSEMNATEMKRLQQVQSRHVESLPVKEEGEEAQPMTRAERLASTGRVTVDSPRLHGSINLKGARFDDIRLAGYRVALEEGSPEVTLLSPAGEPDSYFAQVGWVAQDAGMTVPDQRTPWQADRQKLAAGETVNLHWDNGQGVTFRLAVSLDADYMFTIAQSVQNHTDRPVRIVPYAYINRAYEEGSMQNAILHEGPLGVIGGALNEISYKELRDKSTRAFDDASGWFGITDKYWLAALIPDAEHYKVTFSHYSKSGKPRYQADYLGQPVEIAPGESSSARVRLFAGAKEVGILDRYAGGSVTENQPPVPLFDRAVDFGALYFMTKPMFLMLNFFFTHIGNFGIAIMLLTICVKLAMYPLANKSYKATSQMRELQPEVLKLRERFEGDQMNLNKEMMALYKREKVNPASGCLPVLIQMPVFFALYKVLFVTIEMRHAPFFGWIRDLSAPDPSNLFTAFGLIPWNAPDFLHVGVLPLLMCATMVIQMRQQPKPADPVQAKIIAYMPYFFLVLFATMPAGLVLYWTWSNLISILQQRLITTRHHAEKERTKAKVPA